VSHHDIEHGCAVHPGCQPTRRKAAGTLRGVLLQEREPADAGGIGRVYSGPAEGLAREFAAGATAEEICARTIRALLDVGARHFYISNLPIGRAQQVLANVLEKVESGRGTG
jgi:hypothetical protein